MCVEVEVLEERSDCEVQEIHLSCQKHGKLWLFQRSCGSGDVVLMGGRIGVTRFGPIGPASMRCLSF